jgi:outer membrane beta-barrel protein
MKKFCNFLYLSTLIIFSLSFLGSNAQAQNNEEEAPEAKPVDFSAKDIWNEKIHERPDHKVLVIQNRKFTKSGKFEIGLDFGNTLASAYHNTISGGVRSSYYFNEYWGLQAFVNASKSWFTKDGDQLEEFFQVHDFPSKKEFLEPEIYTGIGVLWNPIYGKFAFFRSNIIHFDIFAGLGVAALKVKSNFFESENTNTNVEERSKTYIGSLANLGLRVFLTKHWIWTTEVRHTYYRADFQAVKADVGTAIRAEETTVGLNTWQITTGVSVLLGGN